MSTTSASATTTPASTSGLSDIEWIVIVVVLVIVLIVLVIAIAKCLEIGKSSKPKSLLQDAQSVHSETVRSTTTRSVASTRASKAKSTNMKKLALNAEITRFSAGRVSRSAEYGVVIKDIKKTVQGDEPSTRMSPPPSYHEQSDTLHTYRDHNTLSSPPHGNLIVNQHYASQGLAPNNSKAVFVAPDEQLYSSPYSHTAPRNIGHAQMMQSNRVIGDARYPILTQPAVLLQ